MPRPGPAVTSVSLGGGGEVCLRHTQGSGSSACRKLDDQAHTCISFSRGRRWVILSKNIVDSQAWVSSSPQDPFKPPS